jgi:replication factor A1
MKISELKQGDRNVELKAKVTAVSEPRQVMTKFGNQITLTTATLDDGSGTIEMSLWGEQSEGVAEGVELEITGAFVKTFKGENQLGLMKTGSIKVLG